MLLFGDDMVPPMAAAMPAREPQPETPAGKASVNLVLPAPLTECTVEDVVRLCTGMKTCIARHEKNKAYMSEEFEGLNLARGDLMQRVKQYVRNYRDSADPDGFLRRVDDFFPMQDELPEIQTLKGVVAELLSKDRLTMRKLITHTDAVHVYDVLQRSKGVPALQNEWDLLKGHLDGMQRAAVDELSTLLHESHPGKIYSDLSRFSCFGSEMADLCAKVKMHRHALLVASQQRIADVMSHGGGPAAVREVLELYQDYPTDLEPARKSIRSYLENLLGTLTMRCDQLVGGESIEEIDAFLLATPEADFGEALAHKLGAIRNRKKDLIQALQLEMRSAARSSDIRKVTAALDASALQTAYVGSERVELQSRFGVLVRDIKSQILSLLQASDYTSVLTMLEQSSSCPDELRDDFAALALHRGTLLEQTRDRMRGLAATDDPGEIDRELAAVKPYYDDTPDELIVLRQRKEALVQQAKVSVLSLLQVRKTPRWPRSWANFSLLQLYSHRDA
jgi:hypothetical protein